VLTATTTVTTAAMDFAEQVVLITDGTSSIGRATALMLAARGARLAIGCGEMLDGEEIALDCDQARGTRETLAQRLRHEAPEAIGELVERALDRWGRLDSMVICSSQRRPVAISELTLEQWQATLDAQLHPVFFGARAALRPMMRQRYGRIVNLASLFGTSGGFDQADHAAAMGGVIGMTRAAARELAPWNITVNAVAPGLISGPELEVLSPDFIEWGQRIIALRRTGSPEEVAGAVCFLASAHASYITGQILTVDGGWRIA
jgi:3-oxoacyl-[acyl-carrier protein] reductase